MLPIDKIENRTYSSKLVSRREIAEDAYECIFELEDSIEYLPGQYVWVELINPLYHDSRGNRRAFSLASIPDGTRRVTIAYRVTLSNFNKSLCQLSIGEIVNIIGPFGHSFCFPSDNEAPLLLVGGGSGSVPFVSLIRWSLKSQSKRPIILVNVNRKRERGFYLEELERCSQQNSAIRVVNVTGEFSVEIIKDFASRSDLLVYVSGTQDFVVDIFAALKWHGVMESQFHFESVYPYLKVDEEVSKLFINGTPKIEITEHPQVTQSVNLLYELVGSSGTHSIITDIHGTIIFANRAAEKITGFTLQEMLGNTPRLWGGMMSQNFYEKLWKSKLAGETFSGEIVNRRKNGEIYIAATHIAPIKNSKGEIVGFIGSEEDITHLRKSEQAAIENEQRFVQLTEKIPEVYWIIEMQPLEKVAYVTSTFEKIWGVSKNLLYENPTAWIDFIHPEDKMPVIEKFQNFINNKGSSFDVEYRIVRPDGVVLNVSDQGEGIFDEEGKIVRVVRVVRDITKEKTIDKEKTEFVSFASHQLKTPIAAIRWNIESLLSEKYGIVLPKQREILEGMQIMNIRINDLINSLLNVSRIETGVFIVEPVPVNFTKLCEEVIQELEVSIVQKKHTLVKEFEKDLPEVSADPKLLRIIFQNYISNAIKYANPEGKIRVSLKTEEGKIVFSVANSGDAILEQDKSKIFQKMFRTEAAREKDSSGTGLGLYIVKEIVENCGGDAWFTSNVGEETIFYATVPLSGMERKEGTRSLV